MANSTEKTKRGFTTPEKWIIWGVFCLLVGLSAQRFSIFAGLMLLSAGIWLFQRRARRVLALVLSLAGLLSLTFSKFLI